MEEEKEEEEGKDDNDYEMMKTLLIIIITCYRFLERRISNVYVMFSCLSERLNFEKYVK